MIEYDATISGAGGVNPNYQDFGRANFEWRWWGVSIFVRGLGRVRTSTTILRFGARNRHGTRSNAVGADQPVMTCQATKRVAEMGIDTPVAAAIK